MMHWFGDYGYGMGHGYGWFFMILFWIGIILLILYFVRTLSRTNTDQTQTPGKPPLDILKERYARGEISKDEFDRMKKDILE